MSHQIAPILSAILESTSANVVSSIMERDSSGDSYAARFRAETALVTAGLAVGVAAKTANYAPVESNCVIPVNATSGEVTLSLPAAVSHTGRVIRVIKTDTSVNAVLIDGNSSETLNGDTIIYLHFQYESVDLVCDGTGWHLLNRNVPRLTSAKSASFTVGGAGPVYIITVGAGVIVVTLPAAATFKDKVITLKRTDAGAGSVTLTTNSTETVDGTNDPTLVLDGAGTRYDVVNLISDGTNWHYLADRGPAT
jgi:hypothetical protein